MLPAHHTPTHTHQKWPQSKEATRAHGIAEKGGGRAPPGDDPSNQLRMWMELRMRTGKESSPPPRGPSRVRTTQKAHSWPSSDRDRSTGSG